MHSNYHCSCAYHSQLRNCAVQKDTQQATLSLAAAGVCQVSRHLMRAPERLQLHWTQPRARLSRIQSFCLSSNRRFHDSLCVIAPGLLQKSGSQEEDASL